MSEVSEGRGERSRDQSVHKWFNTVAACVGSVMLAGAMTWIWNTYTNHAISSATGCPTGVGAGPGAVSIPVIVAVAVVVVTRRQAHAWYVVVCLCLVTFCLAFVVTFIAMIFSTPGVCFG